MPTTILLFSNRLEHFLLTMLSGNSGCRLDAQDAVRILLPMNIMVFAFDFSGCGLSTGEWVSLGFYERDDLRCIIDYLRKHESVTRIALWGRSMGAVTSIMYSAEDPSVSCCVVDSPFSSLRTLAMELVDKMAAKLPSLVAKAGYKMVRSSVKKQAKFDIEYVSRNFFSLIRSHFNPPPPSAIWRQSNLRRRPMYQHFLDMVKMIPLLRRLIQRHCTRPTPGTRM
jgi:pimeloyl-ACP methyl ester carboxylesterase